MSMSDPIADLLTRIRNGLKARHEEVVLPASNLKAGIARVLKNEGFIEGYKVIEDDKQGMLSIKLKYKNNQSVIEGIKRVSKPSCRVYVAHNKIPEVMSGLGISVLSTPRGVISNRAASKEKVGGEVLCAVW